jgi:hypothetical protein
MNDPQEEYVHPVIAAMQTAYAQMQGAKKQKFEQDLADKEQQLRESQFAEAQKQHQQESDRANEQLNINKTLLEMQQRQEQLHRANEIQDFFYKGGRAVQAPDIQLPGASNPLIAGSVPGISLPQLGKQVIPGTNQEVNPAGFSTPEEAAQRAIKDATDLETAKATAKGTAEEPFNITKSQRDQANRLAEINLQGINANKVAETNHKNELELENLRGHYALAAHMIALKQGNMDNAPLIQNAFDGVMNGQTQFSSLPKDIKEGVMNLAGTKGWQVPTNQKSHAANLDSAARVQELINQARDLAVNYSIDSPTNSGPGLGEKIGGKAAKIYTGVTGSAAPFTDLKSALDTFKANGGALASFYDQQNRKSDQEIVRQALGMFDPRATMEQNLKKLQTQSVPLKQTVKNSLAGMKQDQINYILGSRDMKDLMNSSDNSSSSTDTKSLRDKYKY